MKLTERRLLNAITQRTATIVFVLIAALAVKVYAGMVRTLDIGLEDETDRLAAGVRLGKAPLSAAELSPLYTIWYRLLAVFEPDPAKLYYVNWCILGIGLTLALYVLARRSGASLGAAAAVTTGWMFSCTVCIYPYTPYFSTLLLACAAIAATYVNDRLTAAALLSVVTTMAAFVRPELWAAALLFAGGTASWALVNAVRARRARRLVPGAVALLAIVATRSIIGDPMSGGRALFAFAQHYTMNRIEDGQLNLDPWTDWEPVFRAAFPHARTVVEAARENPSAFLWHVQRNLRLLPASLLEIAEIDKYLPLFVKVAANWALVATIVLGLAGLLFSRPLPRALVRWLPITIPVALAAGASISVVHPRQHYLIPVFFFSLVLFASGTHAIPLQLAAFRRFTTLHRLAAFRRFTTLHRLAAPLFVAVLLVVVPTCELNLLPSLLARRAPPKRWRETVHTIDALRALGVRGHTVVLEAGWSRAFYALDDFAYVPHWSKDVSFFDFVQSRKIELIVINWNMKADSRFRDDVEFQTFLSSPSARMGFVMVPVSGENVLLAVRRDRLPICSSAWEGC